MPRSILTVPRVASFAALAPLCLHLSCLDAPLPRDASSGLRDIEVPNGSRLETTCVPTGPELCFDARDNNCSGIIDEGCGLHTGLLQFTIAWEARTADIDLNVYDAKGELAHVGELTASGLRKEKDCPRECRGQNTENVYLDLSGRDVPKGRYRVVVRLDRLNDEPSPIRVRLGARVGQRSYGMSLELSPGQGTDEKSFEFTL